MSTDWSRYDDVRPLCEQYEAMIRSRGFTGEIDSRLKREIARGAREWREVFGVSSMELLERSLDLLLRDRLTIKSPASCITTARKLAQWQGSGETEDGRRAYAESLRKYGIE